MAVDAAMLDASAADEVERYLAQRADHQPTSLHALPALAAEIDVTAIHLKDEGPRFGLGSFKALGGADAVIRLVLEETSLRLGPTVMAMLECYEPSPVAWRVLSRAADAFMTVGEDEAIAVMDRLARPTGADPAIVAGESGGVGVAGLVRVAGDTKARAAIALGPDARVFVINTEGATDPERYRALTGLTAP